MAAGVLPEPGTEYGPCAEPCAHTDCAASREQAETQCKVCHTEIGYDRRFYSDGGGLVHAACIE